jgi:hypothetical protein
MRKHQIYNRFPIKHCWDVLALGQLFLSGDLDFRRKRNCLNFYFNAGGIDNLHATLTRSGQSWTQLSVAIALDLANGGDGEYYYDKTFWMPRDGIKYTKLDWRTGSDPEHKSFGELEANNPNHFHTHHPYFRLRCSRLKEMRIVVVVRHILESLESNYFKRFYFGEEPNPLPGREDSFDWDNFLDEDIEFCNSWGDVLTWHENCMALTYDEIVRDPVGCHKAMTDMWRMNIPESCLEEAFRRTTKEEMKKRMPPSEDKPHNIRVSFRKNRGIFPEESTRYIIDRLKKDLVYDFGYVYEYDTPYGTHKARRQGGTAEQGNQEKTSSANGVVS